VRDANRLGLGDGRFEHLSGTFIGQFQRRQRVGHRDSVRFAGKDRENAKKAACGASFAGLTISVLFRGMPVMRLPSVARRDYVSIEPASLHIV
jgi:hypothetical protein